MSNTITGPDGRPRCSWCSAAPEFFDYHDKEWGFPVGDDRRLFEKLCLESFQSGLSWRTILAKRENFRAAFHGFDFDKVARFGQGDIERLLQDRGIVRRRGKIEAVINNARRLRELVRQEGSLAAFVWRCEPEPAGLADPQTVSTSAASIALSKELNRGAVGAIPVGGVVVSAILALVDNLREQHLVTPTKKGRERVRTTGLGWRAAPARPAAPGSWSDALCP